MKHKAKVVNEDFIIFDPILFKKNKQCLEGKTIIIDLKEWKGKRSLPANARHWARMTYAAHALGDRTPEELHYDFCSYFLTDRTVTPPRVRGSSELNTTEFKEWEEDIDRLLATYGIVIPEPEKGET